MIYLHLNIKHLRKLMRLSQVEISVILNVTHSTISSYELGNSKPSFEAFLKLRDLFNVNLDDLIFKDLSKADFDTISAEINEPETPYSKLMEGKVIELQEKRILQLEQAILQHLPDRVEELQIIDKSV